MILTSEQLEAVAKIQESMRVLEQHRKAVNTLIAAHRLPGVRPVFLPFASSLYGDVERALLSHEFEANARSARARA